MNKFYLKFFCVGLSILLFLSNSLGAHATETNFWKDRQSPLVVASLPSLPIEPPASFLNQLPAAVKFLPNPSPKQLSSLLSSLPLNFGSIRNISVPTNGKSQKTVIHIQDVHLNPEAQTNIKKTVSQLIENDQVGVVGLEGAFGAIDLDVYRQYPNQQTLRIVADYLLRENKISGPVHAGLTNPADRIPAFVGVDDSFHYKSNIEAYRASSARTRSAQTSLLRIKTTQDQKKKEILNPALFHFDSQVRAYESGQIKMAAYLQILTSTSEAQEANLQIETFLEAAKLEAALDFANVEAERAQVISQLVRKLSPPESDNLFQYSVSYRLGKMKHGDFYDYLSRLCREKEISLSRYKSMNNFLHYVLLTESIDPAQLFQEIKLVENKAFDHLVITEEERNLIEESRCLSLAMKLVDFSLTPEEWEEYKNSLLTMDHGLWTKNLSSFERFYIEAEARNNALAHNLLRHMEEKKTSVGILVTGGFHSPGIEQILKEEGVTTISFVPKITKVETETGSRYLSVFTQEKTPLDKLFSGEKLFMAPSPTQLNGIPRLAILVEKVLHPNLTLREAKTLMKSFGKKAAEELRKIWTTPTGSGLKDSLGEFAATFSAERKLQAVTFTATGSLLGTLYHTLHPFTTHFTICLLSGGIAALLLFSALTFTPFKSIKKFLFIMMGTLIPFAIQADTKDSEIFKEWLINPETLNMGPTILLGTIIFKVTVVLLTLLVLALLWKIRSGGFTLFQTSKRRQKTLLEKVWEPRIAINASYQFQLEAERCKNDLTTRHNRKTDDVKIFIFSGDYHKLHREVAAFSPGVIINHYNTEDLPPNHNLLDLGLTPSETIVVSVPHSLTQHVPHSSKLTKTTWNTILDIAIRKNIKTTPSDPLPLPGIISGLMLVSLLSAFFLSTPLQTDGATLNKGDSFKGRKKGNELTAPSQVMSNFQALAQQTLNNLEKGWVSKKDGKDLTKALKYLLRKGLIVERSEHPSVQEPFSIEGENIFINKNVFSLLISPTVKEPTIFHLEQAEPWLVHILAQWKNRAKQPSMVYFYGERKQPTFYRTLRENPFLRRVFKEIVVVKTQLSLEATQLLRKYLQAQAKADPRNMSSVEFLDDQALRIAVSKISLKLHMLSAIEQDAAKLVDEKEKSELEEVLSLVFALPDWASPDLQEVLFNIYVAENAPTHRGKVATELFVIDPATKINFYKWVRTLLKDAEFSGAKKRKPKAARRVANLIATAFTGTAYWLSQLPLQAAAVLNENPSLSEQLSSSSPFDPLDFVLDIFFPRILPLLVLTVVLIYFVRWLLRAPSEDLNFYKESILKNLRSNGLIETILSSENISLSSPDTTQIQFSGETRDGQLLIHLTLVVNRPEQSPILIDLSKSLSGTLANRIIWSGLDDGDRVSIARHVFFQLPLASQKWIDPLFDLADTETPSTTQKINPLAEAATELENDFKQGHLLIEPLNDGGGLRVTPESSKVIVHPIKSVGRSNLPLIMATTLGLTILGLPGSTSLQAASRNGFSDTSSLLGLNTSFFWILLGVGIGVTLYVRQNGFPFSNPSFSFLKLSPHQNPQRIISPPAESKIIVNNSESPGIEEALANQVVRIVLLRISQKLTRLDHNNEITLINTLLDTININSGLNSATQTLVIDLSEMEREEFNVNHFHTALTEKMAVAFRDLKLPESLIRSVLWETISEKKPSLPIKKVVSDTPTNTLSLSIPDPAKKLEENLLKIEHELQGLEAGLKNGQKLELTILASGDLAKEAQVLIRKKGLSAHARIDDASAKNIIRLKTEVRKGELLKDALETYVMNISNVDTYSHIQVLMDNDILVVGNIALGPHSILHRVTYILLQGLMATPFSYNALTTKILLEQTALINA